MQHSKFSRLCFLQKWHNYPGYGFSLQAIKGKVGHFISEVDEHSPAYASGLRDNDFVVEVNGINVLSEPHYEVVKRITEDENKVALLVLDQDSKEYFEQHGIIVDGYMEDLKKIVCPPYDPYPSTEPMENHMEKLAIVQPIMSNGNHLSDENNCYPIQITSTTTKSSSSSVTIITQKSFPSLSVQQSPKPIQSIQPISRINQNLVSPSSCLESTQTIQPTIKIDHSNNNNNSSSSEKLPSPKLKKTYQIKIIREYENNHDSDYEKQQKNYVNHNYSKNNEYVNQKTEQKSNDLLNNEQKFRSLSFPIENIYPQNNYQPSKQDVNNSNNDNNNNNNNSNENILTNREENYDRQTLNRQQRRNQLNFKSNFAERAKIFNEL